MRWLRCTPTVKWQYHIFFLPMQIIARKPMHFLALCLEEPLFFFFAFEKALSLCFQRTIPGKHVDMLRKHIGKNAGNVSKIPRNRFSCGNIITKYVNNATPFFIGNLGRDIFETFPAFVSIM